MNHAAFIPHGVCLLWNRAIVFREITGNGLTAMAYFSIPYSFLRIREKFNMPHLAHIDKRIQLALLFSAAFILSCGIGHVWDIVTLWLPLYRYESWWKMLTGLISVTVAALFAPEILRKRTDA